MLVDTIQGIGSYFEVLVQSH